MQINAVTSIVTLLDPRDTLEGVPLCAKHAGRTTPPMGWEMVDSRSKARKITGKELSSRTRGERAHLVAARLADADAADEGKNVVPSANEDLSRPEGRPELRRKKKVTRAKSVRAYQESILQTFNPQEDLVSEDSIQEVIDFPGGSAEIGESDDIELSDLESGKPAPKSRPPRRRPVVEEEMIEEGISFPWHHHFGDDKPAELEADSPLLSRAFRATN